MKTFHVLDLGKYRLHGERFTISQYPLIPDMIVSSFHEFPDALTFKNALKDRPDLIKHVMEADHK